MLERAEISLHFEGRPVRRWEAPGLIGGTLSPTLVLLSVVSQGVTFLGEGTTPVVPGGFSFSHYHLSAVFQPTFPVTILNVLEGATPALVQGAFPVAGDFNRNPGSGFLSFLAGTTGTSTARSVGLSTTVQFRQWRVGQALVTDVTTVTAGGAVNVGATAAMTGFNSLSVNGAGTMQLVSPMRINAPPGLILLPDKNWAAFATLELVFVPEPATGLLFAVSAVSLALFGRSRSARS